MDPLADAEAALGPVRRDGDGVAAEACFAAGLPVFAGHFPGDPLVPGVHQAALVAVAARRALARPDLRIVGLERTKWLLPLRPDQALAVAARLRRDGEGWIVDGEIACAGATACRCRVRLAP
jgi:3-hydroxyacyl-[acyl-carrier-protein] dehydratase